jgi:hypothetical protein
LTDAAFDERANITYHLEAEMNREIMPSSHRRLEETRLEATVSY